MTPDERKMLAEFIQTIEWVVSDLYNSVNRNDDGWPVYITRDMDKLCTLSMKLQMRLSEDI